MFSRPSSVAVAHHVVRDALENTRLNLCR